MLARMSASCGESLVPVLARVQGVDELVRYAAQAMEPERGAGSALVVQSGATSGLVPLPAPQGTPVALQHDWCQRTLVQAGDDVSNVEQSQERTRLSLIHI